MLDKYADTLLRISLVLENQLCYRKRHVKVYDNTFVF